MTLRPLRIPALQSRDAIVDKEGRPSSSFLRSLNQAFGNIVSSFNQSAEILNRLTAAETDIAAQAVIIQDQADMIAALESDQQASQSESSLQNSGVVNEAAALEANAAGTITVANHSRLYGNQTLNPTVTVTGASVVTGQAPDTLVYVYYDDPTRAGGVVSYQYTTDNADAVQTGNRHSVGYVTIPAGPTATGEYTRPRGV